MNVLSRFIDIAFIILAITAGVDDRLHGIFILLGWIGLQLMEIKRTMEVLLIERE